MTFDHYENLINSVRSASRPTTLQAGGSLGSYGELVTIAVRTDLVKVVPASMIANPHTVHGVMNFGVLQDIRCCASSRRRRTFGKVPVLVEQSSVVSERTASSVVANYARIRSKPLHYEGFLWILWKLYASAFSTGGHLNPVSA